MDIDVGHGVGVAPVDHLEDGDLPSSPDPLLVLHIERTTRDSCHIAPDRKRS